MSRHVHELRCRPDLTPFDRHFADKAGDTGGSRKDLRLCRVKNWSWWLPSRQSLLRGMCVATPEKLRWRVFDMATQSGLTEAEAKEFHEQFKTTYTAFVAIAAVAHLLVFAWKPWY
jgi:light-harvesting complex 1 beta chain